MTDVINFLAKLYAAGYNYHSLNCYCSAISSVHEKVDGYLVGQHPRVSRVLKGAFNNKPTPAEIHVYMEGQSSGYLA